MIVGMFATNISSQMTALNESVAKTGIGQWKVDVPLSRGMWLYDFAVNCLGYATILIPGFLYIRYCQRKYEALALSRSPSLYSQFVQLFVFGWKSLEIGVSSSAPKRHRLVDRIKSWKYGKEYLFAFCFIGLLFSHLIWGFYQEKMMTRDYYNQDISKSTGSSSSPERFRDSQFIVFLNRLLAFTTSLIYICIGQWRRKSRFDHAAPVYKYSYASLSNILSSWCQYEALKYVTFPTQVLGKASKIIPTMIVGRLVRGRHYAWHQYITGAIISIGVSVFLLSRVKSRDSVDHRALFSLDTTTVPGIVLIIGYLAFDSFTSNWQSNLFHEYHVGEMQMMCGVNLFSTLFTLIPLLEQGGLVSSIQFMNRHRDFSFDCLTTSVCSAVGQLFIFFTISEFGPVALAVIMTIRQALAILLSCLYYGHQVNEFGILGLCIVFMALLLGQYLNKACKNNQETRRRVA